MNDRPNQETAAPIDENNTMTLEQTIVEQMTALRNQKNDNTNETSESGATTNEEAEVVVPEGETEEVISNDASQPEVAEPVEPEIEEATEESEAPEEVSEEDTEEVEEVEQPSEGEEYIDFIEFAANNPDTKFKFMRKGKEMVIDAKQAAAILGQGGAIHEEARQLKVEKADFDEWKQTESQKMANMTLAMEMALVPEVNNAVAEIQKVQGYNQTFAEQYSQTTDAAEREKIAAGIKQNENYIAKLQENLQASALPMEALEVYYNQRKDMVAQELENRRKNFSDKELRNQYLFNELRDKVAKDWQWADQELIHGVRNIDLISSDEHILSLIRDGLKFREKPKSKSAGNSVAALTTKKGSGSKIKSGQPDLKELETLAKRGDKIANEKLILAKMNAFKNR